MAKQRIHNQRAGHGNGGSSWISYSDMMASLLLVFVLILCVSLYQYFSMMAVKTAELEAKQTLLDAQEITLTTQRTTILVQAASLATKQTELDTANAALAAREADLEAANLALAARQTELDEANAALAAREAELTALQTAFETRTSQLDEMVGVRTRLIRELSESLSAAQLRANVDPTTGDILLDSKVFFEVGSNVIRDEGKALLDSFVPVYLNVLLSAEYEPYLAEIIIEGHTDSTGTYLNNLELSQNRALAVAKYCLQMTTLTSAQRAKLREILTATGRSFSDPILNEDGTENAEASRRVEFKFSLRDAEMIEQMNEILQRTSALGIVESDDGELTIEVTESPEETVDEVEQDTETEEDAG